MIFYEFTRRKQVKFIYLKYLNIFLNITYIALTIYFWYSFYCLKTNEINNFFEIIVMIGITFLPLYNMISITFNNLTIYIISLILNSLNVLFFIILLWIVCIPNSKPSTFDLFFIIIFLINSFFILIHGSIVILCNNYFLKIKKNEYRKKKKETIYERYINE
jgi:hypothetical protein